MMEKFNLKSPTMLSKLLFGGSVLIDKEMPCRDGNNNVVYIKSGPNKGQEKTTNIPIVKTIKGLGLKPLKEWKTKKEDVYKTDEDVLKQLVETLEENHPAKEIIEYILESRRLNKLISTYFDSTEALVYDIDSCVHPSFKHVQTDTGRLGCANPNVQNQSG